MPPLLLESGGRTEGTTTYAPPRRRTISGRRGRGGSLVLPPYRHLTALYQLLDNFGGVSCGWICGTFLFDLGKSTPCQWGSQAVAAGQDPDASPRFRYRGRAGLRPPPQLAKAARSLRGRSPRAPFSSSLCPPRHTAASRRPTERRRADGKRESPRGAPRGLQARRTASPD